MGDLVPIRRSGHISIAVDNSVIVWGGYTEPTNPEQNLDIYLPPQELWIYNSIVNRWVRRETSGAIPPGISGAAAVFLPSEKAVYVMCGFMFNGHANEVYRLDTSDWTWSHIDVGDNAQKPSPRDKLSAWEWENRIYIFGGYGLSFYPYMHDVGSYFGDVSVFGQTKGWNNQLMIFDTTSRSWSNPQTTGASPSPRAAHGSARVGRDVFIFGGRHDDQRLNDLYRLNLSTLNWSQIFVEGNVPVGRSWHTFTPISDRHVCLFGGYTTSQQPLGDVWFLDTVSLQWRQCDRSCHKSPPTPHLWHTAVRTSDDDVVVFGGCSNDILSNVAADHSNDLLVIRISPKTLLMLSLDAVHLYADSLRGQWDDLPHCLSDILLARCDGQALN